MKRSMTIFLTAALVACSKDAAGPAPASWANGIWRASRMNGQPLPYRDAATYPYLQMDSLLLFIFDPPLGGHAGDVFPSETLFFSATLTPTPILCWDDDLAVTVTAGGLTTHAKGAVTTGGGCNVSFAAFNLTRAGDSLVGTWNGATVAMVKGGP